MKFYLKLALGNIKKNKKLYSSYFISTIFSIALYFIIKTVGNSPTLKGQDSITMFLNLGGYVIALFSLIFLFYTNSFVIKNRKKEISLYHILGMEKRNVRSMMLLETIVIALISLVSGIVIGMLLSQITSVIILRILHKSIHFSLIFSIDAFIKTIIIFSIIFFLSLIYNISVVVRSNPIELLKGQNIGEKEPKTKIFLTLLGIIALGAGYYIALSITDPMQAMALFFVAVILVMIGTYCLFTAGSIALLKFLKSRKNFYYQPTHFTSISGLLYRMKQNAVGLANICILCTCVLVTLSSTICLYNGIQDSVDRQCYMDGNIIINNSTHPEQVYQDVKEALKGKKYNTLYSLPVYSYTAQLKKNQVKLNTYDYNNLACVNIVSLEDYNHYLHQNVSLDSSEAYLYSYANYDYRTITLQGVPFTIKDQIKNRQVQTNHCYAPNNLTIILPKNTLKQFHLKNQTYFIGFNASNKVVKETINKIFDKDYSNSLGENYFLRTQNSIEDEKAIYEIYGSLLFIDIFLSIMFLAAAIVIIYNKQISEGFEDQNKFEILQNVGMSQKEVKQTIQFQVLIFFFVPLIVAIIHLAFAYPLILRILKGLLQCNKNVYLISTAGCIGGLVIIYTIIYLMTSKAYYRIVKR